MASVEGFYGSKCSVQTKIQGLFDPGLVHGLRLVDLSTPRVFLASDSPVLLPPEFNFTPIGAVERIIHESLDQETTPDVTTLNKPFTILTFTIEALFSLSEENIRHTLDLVTGDIKRLDDGDCEAPVEVILYHILLRPYGVTACSVVSSSTSSLSSLVSMFMISKGRK